MEPRTVVKSEPPQVRIETAHPKSEERATLPREVKTEIENLRRLVQTIQDRLHALTRT